MKKQFTILMMAAVLTSLISVPAFAAESTPNAETNSTRAHDVEQKRTLTGSLTETVTVLPDQAPNGYSASDEGFVVYFDSDGGSTVSFSVEFSSGPFSVSVSTGEECDEDAAVGYAMSIPADGKKYFCVCDKTVKVQEYTVYERLAGSSNPWVEVDTEYVTTVQSINFDRVTAAELADMDYLG